MAQEGVFIKLQGLYSRPLSRRSCRMLAIAVANLQPASPFKSLFLSYQLGRQVSSEADALRRLFYNVAGVSQSELATLREISKTNFITGGLNRAVRTQLELGGWSRAGKLEVAETICKQIDDIIWPDSSNPPLLPAAYALPPHCKALVLEMYKKGDMTSVPILADMVEDAGYGECMQMCEHLRSNQRHWVGCWACEAVLGWYE